MDTSNQATSGCYKCNANGCPLVSVSGFGTGSATRDVKSSTDNRVSSCGSYAGNGWTVVATGKYSGNNQCYVCQPNACPTGYKPGVSSVADCGSKAADGWSFTASNLANGNDPCGLCSKLKCQNGYSSSVSAANCKPGESFTSLGFSGDSPCGKCEISCPEGFTAGLTDPSQCGVGGEDGWFVEFNGNESCGLCTPKTCGDYGLDSTRYSTVCLSEKVYIGNDLVDCYDCVGCDEFDIYNSTGSLYDVYRDSIDIPCSEWCRYDKYTSHTTGAIPYVIYKKPVKDKAGRSGDCYGLTDVPGYWEIETNEKKMCCCLYGEDLTPSGCTESGQ